MKAGNCCVLIHNVMFYIVLIHRTTVLDTYCLQGLAGHGGCWVKQLLKFTSLIGESLLIIYPNHCFSVLSLQKKGMGVSLHWLSVWAAYFRWKAGCLPQWRDRPSLPTPRFPSPTPYSDFVFTTWTKCSSFNLFPVLPLFPGVLRLVSSNLLPLQVYIRCLTWRCLELEKRSWRWSSSFIFR